jgi:hypothetical protein
MILVHQNAALIPDSVLQAAKSAKEELERLPREEWDDFIKKKSRIWRAFARYLAKMSYGKCWYSEARDSHSFFDVDHFRPKSRAQRSEGEYGDGYAWLAFDWLNFRYAAQKSNRPSRNDDTPDTEGKWDWFPLVDGSPKSTWSNRCEADELPVLLDPTNPSDVKLVTVNDVGRIVPSRLCVNSQRERVVTSAKILGLNLQIVEARKKVIRDVTEMYETLTDTLASASEGERSRDAGSVKRQADLLLRWSYPNREFSLTVRTTLQRLGASDLCATPEEWLALNAASIERQICAVSRRNSSSISAVGGAAPDDMA